MSNYFKVTILNMRKSVSNIFASFILKFGTSETIRDKTNTTHNRYVQSISIHNNKRFKPRNKKEFSEYLAGIIDGNGYITDSELIIQLYKDDIELAHYLKKEIGYGSVSSDENYSLLTISNYKGIHKVIVLIYGIHKSEVLFNDIKQFYPYLSHCDDYSSYTSLYKSLFRDKTAFNNSWWFAGFTDCGAKLNLAPFNLINKVETNRLEIQSSYKIYHKESPIIFYIQNCLGGGNVKYIKDSKSKLFDMFVYESYDLAILRRIILYFDNRFLLSKKHINFLK